MATAREYEFYDFATIASMQLVDMSRLFKLLPYRTLNEIVIDAKALAHNHRTLEDHFSLPVAPVLKSNAYGHGLAITAKVFDQLRPPFLVVDSLYEAYQLQKLKLQTPILIMGYTHPQNLKHKQVPFHWAVFDLETTQALNQVQRNCAVHLFVDTGMHREGLTIDQLPQFLTAIRSMRNITVVGVCSHFADADSSTKRAQAHTQQQIEVFHTAIKTIESFGYVPQWRHIAASAATLKRLAQQDCSMARVGIASYGITPISEQTVVLKPALRFTSTIAQIKQIKKGDWIGYGATFIAQQAMTIALLPAGYYEGIDRRLSNCGVVAVRGQTCPIIGRVSMNMTTIDVTSVVDVQVGDEVEVFAANSQQPNSVAESAQRAGIIPYELLVHLASSVRRRLQT